MSASENCLLLPFFFSLPPTPNPSAEAKPYLAIQRQMVFVQAIMEDAYYLTEKLSVSLKRNVGLALDGEDSLL